MTKNGVPKIVLPEDPQNDNILDELEITQPDILLADKFKTLAVKGGVSLNLKSSEIIEIKENSIGNSYDKLFSRFFKVNTHLQCTNENLTVARRT